MSIYTTIIPSFVPKAASILLLLMGISIFTNEFFQKNQQKSEGQYDYIDYGSVFLPMVVIFLLYIFVSLRFFDVTVNTGSNIVLIMSHLAFFIFLISTKDNIALYIKSYVFFVFTMSLSSLLMLILIYYGHIDIADHYFNLSDATNGSFSRDQGISNSYSFPYFLGLILTGSGQLDLIGYSFIRISGWAHEPTSVTLFISPAIILLAHGGVIKNSLLRFLMLVAILFFWFFAMSVGSMMAFSILYFLIVPLILFIKYFPLRLSLTLTFMALIGIVLIPFSIDLLINSSIFTTKFDFNSESLQKSISMLTWFIPDPNKSTVYYFSNLAMWLIIFIFIFTSIVGLSFDKNNFPGPYYLILLYIVIHSMKGSQETVYYLFFTFFWFYISYFELIKRVRLTKYFEKGER
jgi:hypothetical protein